MSFEVKVQLRDTTIPCDDEHKMNEKFDDLVQELTRLGVPSENIILIGVELSECSMGHTHNRVIRRHPPDPQ